MPTRNVNLTDQLDAFVTTRIQSGDYANVSEVVRAGLRALQEDEAEDRARLEALRTAVAAGVEGPFFDGEAVFTEVFEEIRGNREGNTEHMAAGA